MAEPEKLEAGLDAGLVSAERLTELLRTAGRLGTTARVVQVGRAGTRTTLISHLERLTLEYEGDRADAPASLLLKSTRTDVAAGIVSGGRNEAVFYRDVAPSSPRDVLAECFDVSTGAEGTPCYVLMEDLSATHSVPYVWPVPPDLPACERLIDAYARFHACWWESPRLGTSVGTRFDPATLPALLADYERRWTSFRDMLGDRLRAERATRYERLLRTVPRLVERLRTGRHLTVMHGDAHVWNALHPGAPGATLRIIDWDAWRLGSGVRDLAYMMALHWYPERRCRLERPLLRRYLDTLEAHGVGGYPWDTLLDHYRLAALWQLIIPMWQATSQLPPAIWWSHLERGMLAFEDLGCEALLE
jgi:hypothetical protein